MAVQAIYVYSPTTFTLTASIQMFVRGAPAPSAIPAGTQRLAAGIYRAGATVKVESAEQPPLGGGPATFEIQVLGDDKDHWPTPPKRISGVATAQEIRAFLGGNAADDTRVAFADE